MTLAVSGSDVDASMCRYAKLSGEEIRLDRYAKFRKLGQWEEFLVQGGKWREAREARANVRSLSGLSIAHVTLPMCDDLLRTVMLAAKEGWEVAAEWQHGPVTNTVVNPSRESCCEQIAVMAALCSILQRVYCPGGQVYELTSPEKGGQRANDAAS